MNRRFYQMDLILGLLSAIGPFAIDMYLPALPRIGRSLDTDVATAQMSLTVLFIAIGIGQPRLGSFQTPGFSSSAFTICRRSRLVS